MKSWALLGMLIIAMINTSNAMAIDLGVIGPVYPIAEKDLLAVIEAKLKQKEASGELAKLQAEAQRRVIRGIEAPAPVAGITRATVRRTRYFDPSVRMPADIRDADGRMLVPAGTVANPLNTVRLSKVLLFFDARDAAQVRRAKILLAHYDKAGAAVKPILVGGSYMDFQRKNKIRVWYDQAGTLTTRLGVTRVPALVTQEGLRLRIEEVPI